MNWREWFNEWAKNEPMYNNPSYRERYLIENAYLAAPSGDPGRTPRKPAESGTKAGTGGRRPGTKTGTGGAIGWL